MSKSVIADFVAKFAASELRTETPVQGRIVMNESAVVLVNQRGKTPVPVSAIVDIRLGRVPEKVQEYFEDAVSIIYERDGTRQFAIVEAEEGMIERFRTVLFKNLLHGAHVFVRHPERIGGRLIDFGATEGELKIDREHVSLLADGSPFRIELAAVTGIERVTRTLGETDRPALAVHHRTDGSPTTSIVALDSPRGMLLLERYLGIEYTVELRGIADVTLSDAALRTLVCLYAGVPKEALRRILPEGTPTETIPSLQEHGLIEEEEDDRIVLTTAGLITVNNQAAQLFDRRQ